jgi:hypothetical protein
MKRMIADALSTALLAATPGFAQKIQVMPDGTTSSFIGAPANFTGAVVVTPLFPATDETHATGGLVAFAPGGRTAWHTHPAGHRLRARMGAGGRATEGHGRGRRRGLDSGRSEALAWRHRHQSDVPIALSYMRDGNNVIWLEKVSDEQYNSK